MTDQTQEFPRPQEQRLEGQVLEDKMFRLNKDLDAALCVVPEYLEAKKAKDGIEEDQIVEFNRGLWRYYVSHSREDSGRTLVRTIIRSKHQDEDITSEIYELKTPTLRTTDSISKTPGKNMEIEVTVGGEDPHVTTSIAADKFAAMVGEILNPPEPEVAVKSPEPSVRRPLRLGGMQKVF